MMNKPAKNLFALEHKAIDTKTYEEYYRQCPQSSLLQSAVYGEAKHLVEGFQIERKVVTDGDNPIAIYQVLMKSLPFVGKVARINRGPLFFRNELSTVDDLKQLYRSFYEEWIIKRGFFLQMAPNVLEDTMCFDDFKEAGFIPSDEPCWQSGWLELNMSREELRKTLQQKWRNLLNKAEKMGTEICPVESDEDMDALLQKYDIFMKERNFQSTSSDLIRSMYRNSSDSLYATMAKKDGSYLGAVIIAKHGGSATYLVGITSDEGRKANANYLLLWNGLIHCMDSGLQWFDVGGIDEVNTSGIAHFKKGLGFAPYKLIGEFESYNGLRYRLLSMLKNYYYQRKRKKSGHT
ncbi:MAG: peptidoglycan bridge formation glycyltransferase FemA/FemB family protein [Syntrophaceae bacterium]